MANYYIQTFDHNGKQLLGSDYTSIVRNASYSGKKFNNAISQHKAKLETLKEIHPILKLGYDVYTQPFK